MTHKLPQIYTANHAIFPIQIRKITVHICGNFWVTQYQTTRENNVKNKILPETFLGRVGWHEVFLISIPINTDLFSINLIHYGIGSASHLY